MDGQTYADHISSKLKQARQAMAASNIDQMILFSGLTEFPFRDDLPYPLRPNPYFLEWLHLPEPDHFLCIGQGEGAPILWIRQQEDYWHSKTALMRHEFETCFEVSRYRELSELSEVLNRPHSALVGSPPAGAAGWPAGLQINPEALLKRLDQNRAVKTPWELGCIRAANRIAVRGHQQAERLFLQGASELEIHLGYLGAVGSMESELPYGNIIAINEHAAALHHWQLSSKKPSRSRSLLIDAGASCDGYAADITRTYASESGLFADLIGEMDALQRSIAEQAKPGVSFADLHAAAFENIGALLKNVGLISIDQQSPLFHEVVFAFFPHGLGHFLGVQVHDKGGFAGVSERHPNLRLTRTLAAGQVVTIEPGLYLIPSLLDKLRDSPARQCVNWDLVDELMPYGGIRIEDNLIITGEEPENVTRDAFAALAN